MTFWYKQQEYQQRFAVYFCSAVLASAFGGLLVTAIANMDGVGGKANWRWIFILEGILSILIAFEAGRRPVFLVSFVVYTVFTAGCGFSPNRPAFLFFGCMLGCAAAAPQTVSGDLFCDIFPGLGSRGMTVTLLGLTSNVGPLLGPIISGFVLPRGWQSQFWCALTLAAANWPMLLLMLETFARIFSGYATEPDTLQVHVHIPPDTLAKVGSTSNIKRMQDTLQTQLAVLVRPICILLEPVVNQKPILSEACSCEGREPVCELGDDALAEEDRLQMRRSGVVFLITHYAVGSSTICCSISSLIDWLMRCELKDSVGMHVPVCILPRYLGVAGGTLLDWNLTQESMYIVPWERPLVLTLTDVSNCYLCPAFR